MDGELSIRRLAHAGMAPPADGGPPRRRGGAGLRVRRCRSLIILPLLALLLAVSTAHAQSPSPIPMLSKAAQPAELAASLRMLIGLALLSLAPALLIMLTSFTRIVIILSFLRSALGTQQAPPNSIIIGLSLFLTAFVMHPTWEVISREAVEPYMAGRLDYTKALAKGEKPLRQFMFSQTREKDIALFVRMSSSPRPKDRDAIATYVLIPAFVISELKSAFQIGFVLYLPFLVIDMVVASALMSMGMMMLPPTMIALPFKILLFVMVDGWHLVAQSIVLSFG
jgi:flagellar biosynthesis protein FliP